MIPALILAAIAMLALLAHGLWKRGVDIDHELEDK